MSYEQVLKDVMLFSREAHKGQLYGDKDYYQYHILGVCNELIYGLIESNISITPLYTIIALLHDTLEDTNTTVADIKILLNSIDYISMCNVLCALDCLTKRSGESRKENVNRIIKDGSRIAMLVKYYDSLFNYNCSKYDHDRKAIARQYKLNCDVLKHELKLWGVML